MSFKNRGQGTERPFEHDFTSATTQLVARAALAKAGVVLNDKGDRNSLLQDRNNLRRVINDLRAGAEAAIAKGDDSRYEQDFDALQALASLTSRTQGLIDCIDQAGEMDRSRGLSYGDQLQVLQPKDSLSARFAGTAEQRTMAFGFGDYIKAMVTGTGRQDVRAALSEGTDSAGGYTVPQILMGQVIDQMRAQTVVIQAGALTVPLDTQKTSIARLATDPTAGWRSEAGAIAESDPTFELVTFNARSLAVLVKVSRELLDDSVNINQALTQAFAGAMAVETDRVALFGSGVAPQPLGIFGTTNVNAVSMGANGAQLTNWTKVLDTILELRNYNANQPTALVMAPRTWRTVAGFVDTTGQPLRAPADIETVPRLVSTNVPITQTQGSANNASCIVAGDFSQLMIGVRSELRIEVLRELYAANHQYAFVAHLRMDVQVARPRAFSVLKGIIP